MPESVHSAVVAAPADLLYDLIADVTAAPRFFGNVVHAVTLSSDGNTDRIKRWTTQGGTVRVSEVDRTLDRTAGRIRFRHRTPPPGLSQVEGEWSFAAGDDGRTTVRLTHSYAGQGESLDAGALRQLQQLAKVGENCERLVEL